MITTEKTVCIWYITDRFSAITCVNAKTRSSQEIEDLQSRAEEVISFTNADAVGFSKHN